MTTKTTETAKTYRIAANGTDMGAYAGVDEDAALDAYAVCAGYRGFADLLERLGATREEVEIAEEVIADNQIEALRDEAAVFGDSEQVAICERALAGSMTDRAECADVIREWALA